VREADTSAATIAQVVRSRRDGLRPSERRAAQALMSDYPYTGLLTAAEFAQRSGVSAPTILRLVGQLGFDSYPDFQRSLKAELVAQLQSPLAKAGAYTQSDRSASSLSALADAICANVRSTLETTSEADFRTLVGLLANPKRRIHAVGGRFGESLALYFSRHLRVLRPNVATIAASETVWRDHLIDFGKVDVLICFDIRRYQKNVVRLAEAAAQRGVTVVLFTDQWLSPVARFAELTFPASTAVPSEWDSSVGTLALLEAVISATTKALWPTAETRMNELEQLRHQRSKSMPPSDGAP
jgi:DNA-binding MurR/RpiR family transcriptional regulator